jgi:hypothetical protein
MVIKKTKPNQVIVNAGATVIVDGKNFHCSGTNEKTGNTPAEVIQTLKDCIEQVSKGKGKASRRKK